MPIPPELIGRIPEKVYMAQLITAANLLGYRSYHTYDSRRCESGFPDLLLLGTGKRSGRMLVVEVKRESGKTTPEQDAWLESFRACGVPAYVWRPSDYDDAIAVLEGRCD
jgi:hypothetical protein